MDATGWHERFVGLRVCKRTSDLVSTGKNNKQPIPRAVKVVRHLFGDSVGLQFLNHKSFSWSKSQKKEFVELKHHLFLAHVLTFPDMR